MNRKITFMNRNGLDIIHFLRHGHNKRHETPLKSRKNRRNEQETQLQRNKSRAPITGGINQPITECLSREYDEPDTHESGLGELVGALPSPEELEAEVEVEVEAANTEPKRKGIMDTLVEALNENAGEGEHWERLHSTPQMECGDVRWRNLDGAFANTTPAHDDSAVAVTNDHGGEYDENGEYIKGTGEAVCSPEDGMQESDVPTMITIELPATNIKEDILRALIESKATLIKAALGEDGFGELPIEFDSGEGKVGFNWLRFGADADTIKAWSAFLAAACKFSKTAKRVTAKDTAVTNEKFAFRTFLVKIGMNDAENKWARKHLLRNLTGDSAFATPESKAKWQAKHGKKAENTEVIENENAE